MQFFFSLATMEICFSFESNKSEIFIELDEDYKDKFENDKIKMQKSPTLQKIPL